MYACRLYCRWTLSLERKEMLQCNCYRRRMLGLIPRRLLSPSFRRWENWVQKGTVTCQMPHYERAESGLELRSPNFWSRALCTLNSFWQPSSASSLMIAPFPVIKVDRRFFKFMDFCLWFYEDFPKKPVRPWAVWSQQFAGVQGLSSCAIVSLWPDALWARLEPGDGARWPPVTSSSPDTIFFPFR